MNDAAMPPPIWLPGPHGPIPTRLVSDPARSRAGVLLGHGLSGTMQSQWPETRQLAAAGFATLLPEARAIFLNTRFGPEQAVSLTYPGGHIMDPQDWEDARARARIWLGRRFPPPPGGP